MNDALYGIAALFQLGLAFSIFYSLISFMVWAIMTLRSKYRGWERSVAIFVCATFWLAVLINAICLRVLNKPKFENYLTGGLDEDTD